MSTEREPESRPRMVGLCSLVLAMGFGGGYLIGRFRDYATTDSETRQIAETLAGANENETAGILAAASHADDAGLATLILRHSKDWRQSHLLILLLAEESPAKALSIIASRWQADRDGSLLSLCEDLFRMWAATSPDAAISAVDALEDQELKARAVQGSLDTFSDSDFERASSLLVKWQHNLVGEFPFPDWFEADPKAGLELLASLGTSFLGYQMTWKLPRLWAEMDPFGAVAWMDSHPEAGLMHVVPSILEQWVEADLEGAEAALRAGRFTDPRTVAALSQSLISALAKEKPSEALSWAAENMTGETRLRTVGIALASWAETDAPAAAKWLLAQTDAATLRMGIASLTKAWAKNDPGAAADFALESQALMPSNTDSIYLTTIGDYLIEDDPIHALDWADRLPDNVRSRVESGMFRSLLQQDQATAVAEATRRLARFSRRSVEAFSSAFFTRDPTAARDWMISLPDGPSMEFVRNGLREAARQSPNIALRAIAEETAPSPE